VASFQVINLSLVLNRHVSFQVATARLFDLGFTLLAEGDWSLVLKYPHVDRLVRITPYDAAFRYFAEVCQKHPHPNLPTIVEIFDLSRNGYVVAMPQYQSGVEHTRVRFIDELKEAISHDTSNGSETVNLAHILILNDLSTCV